MKNILLREFIKNALFPKTKTHDESKKIYKELAELERLAKIGEATEKAFKENSCVFFIDSIKGVNECYEFELINVEQLLEWAVEND